MEKNTNVGIVQIADDVVAIIAGLATTEVEGVASMAGNITKEIISKLGMKNFAEDFRILRSGVRPPPETIQCIWT